MPEMKQCEYVLVEYAPSPLRETRVAIGLVLFDGAGRLVRQGFARDWRQVRCLDPGADFSLLEGLAGHFEKLAKLGSGEWGVGSGELAGGGSGGFYEQLRRMHEDGSGGLQISAARGVLTGDPEREFDLLFQEHVEPARRVRESRPAREGSRPWIHAQLSEALRRFSLWDALSKDVPVSEYTAPGDGFRIDFSYRPNGVTKYLHAISLERDWNQAKLLSYSFWRIREKVQAEMTAIVGDVPSDTAVAASCREILAGAGIAVQGLTGIDAYLEGVGRELRR